MWRARHQIISGASVGLALICAACTYTIPLDATLDEPPLVSPLPLTIGVQYADGLASLERVMPEGNQIAGWPGTKVRFELGPPTVALFDQILGTMFQKTTLVELMPEQGSLQPAVDAILQVRLNNFYCIYIQGAFSAQIIYDIKFYSPQQELIAEWRASGKARNESIYFGPAIYWIRSEVVERAMQDAIAQFLTQFEDDPKIANWLRDRDVRAPPNKIESL